MTKEVSFEPIEGQINDLIDNAYRVKYNDDPYLNPMIRSRARSAIIRHAKPTHYKTRVRVKS
ncbi:DUF2255 family protein [Paenibacillus peoriae]|nr:DUF2255 family protein [Paenibacillus peoriae]MEC0180792.1 DUF2255 family protein [Paenibacillus peoriae]